MNTLFVHRRKKTIYMFNKAVSEEANYNLINVFNKVVSEEATYNLINDPPWYL